MKPLIKRGGWSAVKVDKDDKDDANCKSDAHGNHIAAQLTKIESQASKSVSAFPLLFQTF